FSAIPILSVDKRRSKELGVLVADHDLMVRAAAFKAAREGDGSFVRHAAQRTGHPPHLNAFVTVDAPLGGQNFDHDANSSTELPELPTLVGSGDTVTSSGPLNQQPVRDPQRRLGMVVADLDGARLGTRQR